MPTFFAAVMFVLFGSSLAMELATHFLNTGATVTRLTGEIQSVSSLLWNAALAMLFTNSTVLMAGLQGGLMAQRGSLRGLGTRFWILVLAHWVAVTFALASFDRLITPQISGGQAVILAVLGFLVVFMPWLSLLISRETAKKQGNLNT